MPEALLIVAHGSRRVQSNDEIRALTGRVRQAAGDRFTAIECAFLELAPPSIPEGLAQLIDGGATDITVLPYFLAAGRHVAEDIPAEVEPARIAHPQLSIVIAPYLGRAEAMPELLLTMIGAAC